MTSIESETPSALDKGRAGALAMTVAAIALAILPLRVIGTGFRPPDDAKRHAAKAISGKSWTEILVSRPEATVDPHPGWHAILSTVHRAGVRTPTGLAIFSAVSLAMIALVVPLFLWRGPPEAWLLALLVTGVFAWPFFFRLMLGRPFDWTIAALLGLLMLWRRLRGEAPSRRVWAAIMVLAALSAWIHGNWYLWALPLAAFVLARELRVAMRVAAAVGVGIAAGALATGTPVAFLTQTFLHPFWALGSRLPTSLLVGEFKPEDGSPVMVLVIAIFVLWRVSRGRPATELLHDPVAILAGLGWSLGFVVQRFWWDWGAPAVIVWLANEFARELPIERLTARSRLLLTTLTAAVLLLAVPADASLRWSQTGRSTYLDARNPRHRPWLPDPGGILYSNSMTVFYDTFLRNPNGAWRYALGFEPTWMTRENLDVLREIDRRGGADGAYSAWVARLGPEDRLVIVRKSTAKPRIARLEWYSPYAGMWIGRLPRQEVSPATSGPHVSGTPTDSGLGVSSNEEVFFEPADSENPAGEESPP